MITREEMEKLLSEYGIHSEKELDIALEKALVTLDIGIMSQQSYLEKQSA